MIHLKNCFYPIIYFVVFFLFISCFNESKKIDVEDKIEVISIPVEVKKNADSLENQNFKLITQNSIELVKSFEEKMPLRRFFEKKWTFEFHHDDRCEGSTDGKINDLDPNALENIICLQVFQDGIGWLCEAQKPQKKTIYFDLHKELEKWDRFEGVFSPNKTFFYIFGVDVSTYMVVHFNHKGLIHRLEYRMEDPG
jgi:hypothetical protein